MNAITPITADKASAIVEAVITRGDLADLSDAERAKYYVRVCESIGLNPMTQPFQYITLNGRLTLYARKDATDQLRNLRGVSIEIVSRQVISEVLTVHVRAKDKDGRTDEDFGAVPFPESIKGEVRANTILKAITKAKRRVTLSICGLGWLDETEIEDIPASAKAEPRNGFASDPFLPETGSRLDPVTEPGNGSGLDPFQTPKTGGRTTRQPKKTLPKKDCRGIYMKLHAEMKENKTAESLNEWVEATKDRVSLLHPEWQEIIGMQSAERMMELQQKARAEEVLNDAVRRHAGHDADGVVWDEAEVRKPTEDDGLTLPAALRVAPKREPSVKERLLADIPRLATARDCLAWGLEMDRFAAELPKADRDEISAVLLDRQAQLIREHVPPAPHQRRLFPIDGGNRAH
jgi:hypothetical protein